GLRALLHEQVAGVEGIGEGGDSQVDVLTREDLQRTIDTGGAAGIGVEDEHDARGEAAELTDMPAVERRAHGGNDLEYAHLVCHQNVRVSFHHGEVSRPVSGLASLVQPVQMFALGEQWSIG